MADPIERRSPRAQAEQRVAEILRAAGSWAKEAPPALNPAVRAVCLRLAEMVADQRHYLAPLPEPQESERREVLTLVAERLTSPEVTAGLEKELATLTELRLRATGSWALVPTAQSEWTATAIQFLEKAANELPPEQRPDPYWADDVVAGIIASVRAVIGVDELHARTEAIYSGPERRATPRGVERIDD
ncbi:MAG TPA: hypothetical protein VNK43_11560 [Gemmatimonadales bacterium]|nr:hypothetical protein [Gemmatimonadales bacterium]